MYGADPFVRDPAPIGSLAGKILTTNFGDDTLSVLDPALPGPARRLVVGFNPIELEGPHHIAADPTGKYVYVNLSLRSGHRVAAPMASTAWATSRATC